MAAQHICFDAPAKINLYLKILRRRADGYHELQTLMQKLALYDHLQISLKSSAGISLDCGQSGLPEDENNIIFRAATLFLSSTRRKNQGLKIVLQKKIPVAAGLGGGSSDAAAVLLSLNTLLETGCSRAELAALGLQLGADVPLFVYDMAAAWATGIGEKLEQALPLAHFQVVLVNPGFFVSTKWVYETFALTLEENIFNLYSSQNEVKNKNEKKDYLEVGSFCSSPFKPQELLNDLEKITAGKFSVINEIKEKMHAAGAVGAMMSGSGPTVFGLFPASEAEKAAHCCRQLQQEFDQVYLVNPLS